MEKSTKIWLVISGILLVVLGILCIAKPAATLFATAWLIGCFTLFSGISRLVFTQNRAFYAQQWHTYVVGFVADIHRCPVPLQQHFRGYLYPDSLCNVGVG